MSSCIQVIKVIWQVALQVGPRIRAGPLVTKGFGFTGEGAGLDISLPSESIDIDVITLMKKEKKV